MQEPLLLDMVNYLVDNGIVIGDGIDAFRDFVPDKPDNIVILYEYAGEPKLPFESMVHRSVQVTVRDTDADVARSKALSIFNLLDAEDKVIKFTDNRWGQVSLRQPPAKLKTDKNERVTYGFNVGISTTIY